VPVYEDVAVAAPAPVNGQGPDPVAQSVAAIQVELNDYLRRLKDLNSYPPVEVFQTLSAISARLAEIRNRLVRTDNRRFTALRTKEVDPLIEEVDRQFKFHSRIQAVRDSEMRLAGVVT
jgi:hypothetical protein